LLITVSVSINDYYVDKKAKELKYQANRISGSISKANYINNDTKKWVFDTEIAQKSSEEGFRIIVTDKMAVVVNDSGGTEIGKTFIIPEIVDALNRKDVARLQDSGVSMYAAASVLNESSDVIGAVLIISPVDEIESVWREISGKFVMIMVVLTLAILVLVLLLSQFIINPLNGIINSVRKITEGHLNQRITPAGSVEFIELSKAFNDMTSKLEQTETTRQEFVSNVSHELKTPLSSMKVLSESLLMMDTAPIETYREFLRDINSEVDRMADIINELLTLVKLDRPDNALNIKQIGLNRMLEGILKRLYPLAEQHNIELLFQDIKNVILDADEMKLSLAISNLIENGIKYTNEGGMVKVIADSDGQNAFITVIDNGIGIAEDEQVKIFTRFYRVDKTRDRDTGGTGLGLAITYKTVLLHNGSIKLVSKEGEGSSFVVRLPLHRHDS
jgi:signal transduction histidine kinase